MLKGSLVILNNVILRFKLCVEISFVFIYLLSWAQQKVLLFESSVKQHGSDNAKRAEFTKLCVFPSSASFKKMFLQKDYMF